MVLRGQKGIMVNQDQLGYLEGKSSFRVNRLTIRFPLSLSLPKVEKEGRDNKGSKGKEARPEALAIQMLEAGRWESA